MLMVDFINVGYGDAILIREQTNGDQPFCMLIDCGDVATGPNDAVSKRTKAADFLLKNSIAQIDLLVLSHLHLDHTGGLADLVPGVKITELWANYVPEKEYWDSKIASKQEFSAGARCLLTSLAIYCRSLTDMAKKGTKIKSPAVPYGTKSLCGGRLRLEYFCGDKTLQNRQREILKKALLGTVSASELDELDHFINNTSIHMRITYGNETIELPGDMSAGVWDLKTPKPCTIVKLPHHGHKDSLTESLLGKLSPEFAVISVCNYREDDCPSGQIIEMLRQRNIKFYFTDAVALEGNIPVYHESVQFVLPFE